MLTPNSRNPLQHGTFFQTCELILYSKSNPKCELMQIGRTTYPLLNEVVGGLECMG